MFSKSKIYEELFNILKFDISLDRFIEDFSNYLIFQENLFRDLLLIFKDEKNFILNFFTFNNFFIDQKEYLKTYLKNPLTKPQLLSFLRNKTGIKLCFTLDAGPNVHLLYSENDGSEVEKFIKNNLLQHCNNNMWIADKIA